MATLLDSATVNNDVVNYSVGVEAIESPVADKDEAAYFAARDKSDAEFVTLAIDTLDPTDRLMKYARLGSEALKRAVKAKASLAAGSWDGKKDLPKIFERWETLIRTRSAVKEIELDKYVRIHLWVKAMKPLVPGVEKLSFYQVKQKFLPTLEFDSDDLTGEIRKGWIGWLTSTVDRQIGDDPMTMKELDDSIATRKAEIEAERNKSRDPQKQLEAEQKAADAKLRNARDKARNNIMNSIDSAISDKTLKPSDIGDVLSGTIKTHGVAIPGVFDPATCNTNDVRTLATALLNAGKLAEMTVLRNVLTIMIDSIGEQMSKAS